MKSHKIMGLQPKPRNRARRHTEDQRSLLKLKGFFLSIEADKTVVKGNNSKMKYYLNGHPATMEAIDNGFFVQDAIVE